MWELNDVISIEYRDGFTFHIRFDDDLEGDVDFTEYLGRGPVFEPLKDQALFRKARIEGGTIAWSTGADIAAETLYKKILDANQAVQPTPSRRG